MNAPTRFSERQTFPVWAYAALALAAAGGALAEATATRRPLPTLLGLLGMGAAANLLLLQTEVTDREIIVTFGALFPLYRRTIPLGDIAHAESVVYSPLGEFGGWGIRGWGGSVALNARGDRGVRLTLRDGRRVLIGSQRPDELQATLRTENP